jgi:hypothetical protein
MPYTAEISRANPTCIVFLIDQSDSMKNPFGRQPEKKKSEGVADAVNKLLSNLALKCAEGDTLREYFWVSVIGYGKVVGSALGGELAGRKLVSIGEIANNPLRVEQRTRMVDDGTGSLVKQTVKFPIWFEPQAGGRTPLPEALDLTREILEGFLRDHPDCFPPLIINISDGMANTDPRPAAKAVRNLASSDGAVLLFNAHISDKTNRPIEFPDREAELPDNFAKLLFRMSSVLPGPFVKAAREEGFPATAESRGFVFNADLVSIIQFLSFGTKVAQNRNLQPGE